MNHNEGYVYLAYCSTGHFKIGRSLEPEIRVKHFDTIMPVEVRIIHKFYCDDAIEAEAILHKNYHEYRCKGEWFDFSYQYASERLLDIFCYIDGIFHRQHEIDFAADFLYWGSVFKASGMVPSYAELPY